MRKSLGEYMRTRAHPLLIMAIAALPLILAGIAGMHAGWFATGDEALTGLSAFDVFTGHPPVMGPRTTTAFETGIETHHPGPLLYYLLAPTSALSEGAGWGLILGSVIINCLVIGCGVFVAYRLGGLGAAAAVGAAFLGVQWALGPEAGARPFNPYPPVFAVVTFLVVTWALLLERLEYVPHYVAVSSLMVQGHISYLPFLAGPVLLLALVGMVRWGRRRHALWPLRGWRPPDDGRYRRPALIALALGSLLWLPPLIELFRFAPNNLQQIYAYVGADRGTPLPVQTGLRFVAGLVAPIPGGMSPSFDQEGTVGSGSIAEAMSTTAVVMGGVMVGVVLVIACAGFLRPRARAWPDRARQLVPTRVETVAAAVAVMGVVTLAATVSRLPESSAQTRWNYLQAWPVAFVVWAVLLVYFARVLLSAAGPHRHRIAVGASGLLLVAGVVAALLAPVPSRWQEGDGIATGMDDVKSALAAIDRQHPGRLHVTFTGDNLGAGYFVAPALAHDIRSDYSIHLPAVWKSKEDTDFRKSVSSPKDTAWVDVRSGSLATTGRPARDVHPRAMAVAVVHDAEGRDFTVFVRGPDPA